MPFSLYHILQVFQFKNNKHLSVLFPLFNVNTILSFIEKLQVSIKNKKHLSVLLPLLNVSTSLSTI